MTVMPAVKRWLLKGVEGLQHLFFPHICAGCGTDLITESAVLCLDCLNNLPVTGFHRFAVNPVEKIFRGRIPLVSATSLLYFTKDSLLQSLLHQLKYQGKKDLGVYFGKRIGEAYTQIVNDPLFDAIVPLPLHPSRQRKRGYNQAAALADGISEVLQVPVLENVVRRSIQTNSQTQKNRLERWDNMEGKFILEEEEALYGRHVLLVDDVVTTGATLEACGSALLKTEGLQLSISTLAYTAR